MMNKVVSNYLDQARSLSNSTILPLVDLGLMTPAITMEENVQFRVRVFEIFLIKLIGSIIQQINCLFCSFSMQSINLSFFFSPGYFTCILCFFLGNHT